MCSWLMYVDLNIAVIEILHPQIHITPPVFVSNAAISVIYYPICPCP